MGGPKKEPNENRGRRSPVNRRPGRPKADSRAIGPAEHALIGRLDLRSVPHGEIAEQLGVTEATIRHHLERNIRPFWRVGIQMESYIEIAKIDELERIAWIKLDEGPERTETVKRRPGEGLGGEITDIAGTLREAGTDQRIVEHVLKTVTRNSTVWAQVILWCIQERCRIRGHYAKDRVGPDHGGLVRVAGKARADLDKELESRIEEIIISAREKDRLERKRRR